MVKFQDEKQDKKIEEILKKEEEDLAMILSKKYGVSYINLFGISIGPDALGVINEKEARDALVAPFKKIGKKLLVAVLSPNNSKTKEVITSLEEKNYIIEQYIVSKESLEHAWDRYSEVKRASATQAGVLDILPDDISALTKQIHSLGDISALVKKTISDPNTHTSRVLEVLVAGALSIEASDIHIEPEESDVRLRYRLDGVLQDITSFDYETYRLLESRIKLISGLKLNVKNIAQDGRFSIKIGNEDIEIRTSVLPGAYGESLVMRVLNPKTILVEFENLGMDEYLREILSGELSKPNGMILTTGPTGSGKTTTLYAFLKKIYSPEIKIVTIEDPIEYHIKGITQTQVNKDVSYTFAKGLRSTLRQDPDVIMVGEIRDAETAETAVNAALTGHLVFSTLHTNNAAGTIPRLIDLGVDPKVLSSALNIFLAQRLIRKLCESCKIRENPSQKEISVIESVLKTIPRDNLPTLKSVYRAGKCTECNNTGYKGRIGLFEGIIMDSEIDKAAVSNPNEREIKKAAEPQKILDMKQEGIIKVLAGITSLEELGRVVDLSET